MASKNIEFKVGIIILLGAVVLVASLFWLEGYRLDKTAQLFRIRFDDVGTLAIGDRVTVSGVRKGKVNNLQLTDQGVVVEILLAGDVKLKQDAQFVIKNLGLMGERFVAVAPGRDSVPFDTSIVIDGLYDTGLPEVMGLLGEMIVDLRDLVATVKKTVGSDTSMSRFDRMVSNLEQVSSSLATYLKRNEGKLDKSADNFFQASRQLREIIEHNASTVDSSMQRIDRVSVKLEQFAERLDSLSIAANDFADLLNNPDGSVQLLLEDRRLYDDLRKTADNIDELVKDIRANPRKYLNVTVEIF